MTRCSFGIHSWNPWHEYQHDSVMVLNAQYQSLRVEQPFVEVRQKRSCARCGYTQDVKVRSGILAPPPSA